MLAFTINAALHTSGDQNASLFRLFSGSAALAAEPKGGAGDKKAGGKRNVSVTTRQKIELREGDKIQVDIYEVTGTNPQRQKLDAARQRVTPTVMLRNELSGQHTIDQSGTFSIPLLGSIVVAGRSIKDIEEDLAKAHKRVTGRPGTAVVNVIARPPVYVIGAVKTPGVYKYTGGMTAMHAIALSGGLERKDIGSWQNLELNREVTRYKVASDELKSVLSRKAVLSAEMEGTKPVAPRDLVTLAGRKRAAELIVSDYRSRKPFVAARKQREEFLAASIKRFEEQTKKVRTFDSVAKETVDLGEQRVAGLRKLEKRGLVASQKMIIDQIELSRAKELNFRASIQNLEAERRLAEAKEKLAEYKLGEKKKLQDKITLLDRDLSRLLPEQTALSAYIEKNSEIITGAVEAEESNWVSFSLVRRRSGTAETQLITGTTDLQPGDLVVVKIESTTGKSKSPTLVLETD